MAIKYGFFDSIDHDRVYNAEDMSRYFDGLVEKGVVDGVYSNLQPYVRSRSVGLHAGRAFVDCRWYDQSESVTIKTYSLQTVKALIVLTLDYDARAIAAEVIDGTATDFPAVTDSDKLKYLKLAEVTVTESAIDVNSLIGSGETPLLQGINGMSEKIKAATTSKLGTVMIGEGLQITESGLLSATGAEITIDASVSTASQNPVENRAVTAYVNDKTKAATASSLGTVKVGNGLEIDSSGVLSATGTEITVDEYVSISSTNPIENQAITNYVNSKTETASASRRGTVKIGSGLTIDQDGTLSATGAEITIDDQFSTTSGNPVQNKVISAKVNSIDAELEYMSEHKVSTTQLNAVEAALNSKINEKLDITGKAASAAEADSALTADGVKISNVSANSSYPVAMVSSGSTADYSTMGRDSGNNVTYNPYTKTLTAENFSGTASQVTQNYTGSNTTYPVLLASTTDTSSVASVGGTPNRTNAVTINPYSGTVKASKFDGKATSANSADYATNAGTATSADSSTTSSQVTQSYTGSNSTYPVLLASTTSTTSVSNVTGTPNRTNAVTINPYSGTVKASKFDGKATSAGTADYATSAGSASSADSAGVADKIAASTQSQLFSTNLSSASSDYTIYVSGLFNDCSLALFRFLHSGGSVYKNVILPMRFIYTNASSTPYRCYVSDVPMEFYRVSSSELRIKVHSSSSETFKQVSLIRLY